MTNNKSFIRSKFGESQKLLIVTAGILMLAFVLRFYDYQNRWGLAYDQAHDALIARYALENWKIPLLGPFSSAGPFQTGGQWYWILMAATITRPEWILSPWILFTLSSVVFVYLTIVIGKELIDYRFGIIVGALSAVSTAQIAQSLNLTNQTPLSLISLLAIWSSFRFIKTRKKIYAFSLGLLVSLGASVHLQGVALIVLPVTTFVLIGFPHLAHIFSLILGLFLPSIPILIHDVQHQFFNTKNMITYYLFNPNQITYDSLGRRWFTYLGQFWPTELAHIIGGNIFVAYFSIVLILFILTIKIYKRVLPKELWILLISSLFMVAILRYTRTPLYSSYLTFLHPFIIFIVGYVIYEVYKKIKLVGVVIFLVITIGSIYKDIKEIRSAENFTSRQVSEWKEIILKNFPHQSFAIYDLNYARRDKSLPLTLYLDVDNKIRDDGIKIGVGIITGQKRIQHPAIYGTPGGYQLYDLSSSGSAQLSKEGWVLVNPSEVYRSTEDWQSK